MKVELFGFFILGLTFFCIFGHALWKRGFKLLVGVGAAAMVVVVAVATYLVFSAKANAAELQASCESVKMVNGKMVVKSVPCTNMETPIPCAKEWTDADGTWHSEERKCMPGEQKTVEQTHREEEAARKKQCGKDYKAMHIGMTLDRFEQCTDGLIYITDTVIKGAVLESYRSTFYIIHAKDGKIVAYTRRTH